MIEKMEPQTLAKVAGLIEKTEETEKIKQLKNYLKKFVKIKEKEAEKLKQELEALDLIKLREEHIVKIIDILPEDLSDLNKIFNDTSLDEEEANKILEVVRKYK